MAKATAVEEDDIEEPEIDQSVIDQKIQRQISAKVVFDKKIDFTKDVARQFIEMPEFTGERPLRDGHVESLCKHAKDGTFLMEQASLIDCVCKYDSSTVRRLNGHHTCWMRHFMPDNWAPPKIRHLRYEVSSEEDFRKLYSLQDRGAARSTAHVAQARLYQVEQYKGLTKKAIKHTKDGLVYWLWGNDKTERGRHKIDEIVDLMETGQYYPICHDVASFINDLNASEYFMKRACVIGAVFATFNKAKADANQFWTSVRTGVGIDDPHDPRKTLRDYLCRMRVIGANSYNRASMVPGETMFRACIYCWNAWRRKETLRQINAPTSENRPPIK